MFVRMLNINQQLLLYITNVTAPFTCILCYTTTIGLEIQQEKKTSLLYLFTQFNNKGSYWYVQLIQLSFAEGNSDSH